MTRPIDESEFGGAPGMIQPPPHKMSHIDQFRLERKLDPSDPEDTIEAASIREGNRQQ